MLDPLAHPRNEEDRVSSIEYRLSSIARGGRVWP
jgi:hypothetical protein